MMILMTIAQTRQKVMMILMSLSYDSPKLNNIVSLDKIVSLADTHPNDILGRRRCCTIVWPLLCPSRYHDCDLHETICPL